MENNAQHTIPLPPTAFLVGTKVFLRPAIESDVRPYCAWRNAPDVQLFTNLRTRRAWTEDFAREVLITNPAKGAGYHYVICETATTQAIGTIGITDVNRIHQRGETFMLIGEARDRMKGFGREAKMLLLKYAFGTLNFHTLTASTTEHNAGSIACLKRCGYQQYGLLPDALFIEGQWIGEVLFYLTAAHWQKGQP